MIEKGTLPVRVDDDLLSCLIYIAEFHGMAVTEESVKAGLPMPGGKITPSLFPRAARRAGLIGRLVRQSPERLNRLLFPVVLLLKDERACVLVSIDNDEGRAAVFFPETGRSAVDVDLQELLKDYGGYAIYARPEFRFDERTVPRNDPGRENWFWATMAGNRSLYRDLILGTLMINIFALAMPLFVMNVYNRVVPNRAEETLWVLASVVLIIIGADFMLRMMRAYFTDLAAVRTNVRLSAMLFERFMGLRMEEKPVSTGAFAANIQAFESVRQFISSAVVTAYVDLPFAFVFVLAIALISWPLAVPILAGGVLMLLYSLYVQGSLRDISQTSLQAGAMRNSLLVEYLAALETVKILGIEGMVQGKWERLVVFLERTGARLRFLSASLSNGALWVQFTVSVIVMVMGVYLIFDGSLSTGGLIAVYILSSRAMAPIGRTAGLLAQYHQASRALASLDDLVKKEIERPEGVVFDPRNAFMGGAAFKEVSFSYPGNETPVLDDLDLSIKPGEKVAVIGRVGSGKSTLARLLPGLYRPQRGTVHFDNIDIRQIDPADLRHNVGYIPQDVTLFYGTLRENIVMAAKNIYEADLLAAVRMAGLGPFVDNHPKGLDLNVGERGERLSTGQRQAVGLARVFVKNAPFLLLDEPTSSMDRTSEEIVIQNIREYAQNRTLLLITHKANLLELVDRVVVIGNGKVVMDGPKAEILEKLKAGGGEKRD